MDGFDPRIITTQTFARFTFLPQWKFFNYFCLTSHRFPKHLPWCRNMHLLCCLSLPPTSLRICGSNYESNFFREKTNKCHSPTSVSKHSLYFTANQGLHHAVDYKVLHDLTTQHTWKGKEKFYLEMVWIMCHMIANNFLMAMHMF